MRKRAIPLLVTLFGSFCSVALAHGDMEELGHHWYVAKYSSEVKLQTMAMVAFILCVVMMVLIKRAIYKRKNRI